MTFELQRDPLPHKLDRVPQRVVVRKSQFPGRIVLDFVDKYELSLNFREVDDLVTALQYYKALAEEQASRGEN